MSDYIKIHAKGDDAALVHLMNPGLDYTICGFDTEGDSDVHEKPPVPLIGTRRITCPRCIAIIEAVKNHLTK